ncbi:unnamed protein product [Prunus armeniaca]|uniref:Uncharacterized protein n=1 Tax=Prunus armeniaca TaxID=36596 RepID=A0A6J5TMR7_PRUAR|nr:unnamed protein product [Prunus armeniaca]
MLHHLDQIDNVPWPKLGGSERVAPQDHFEDTVPGYLEWYLNVGYPFVQNPNYGAVFDPFASMQSIYYQEREERMLSFTMPLVALGETVALHTRPSQVYQAVETLQQIL